jgi:hypothetical protein
MTVKIQFAEMPRVPTELPVYAAMPPQWTQDQVARLAERFELKGDVADAGLWYVCRSEALMLEVYQASHSMRIERRDLDGEGRGACQDAPDRERSLAVAQRVMERFGGEFAKPRLHTVTELEVQRATRGQSDVERQVVALQVNYRYEMDGLPLVGPGAKAQITVGADGDMMQAYRFARAAERIESRATVAPEDALRRFAASDMFTQLDGRAKVAITSTELGLLSVPPTEVQSVLVPVYVIKGEISTEQLPRYAFVRYVAATDLGDADIKRRRWEQVRPALLAA